MGFQSETCEHVNLSHDLVVSPSTPKSPLSIKFPSQPRRIRSTDRLISLEKSLGVAWSKSDVVKEGSPLWGSLLRRVTQMAPPKPSPAPREPRVKDRDPWELSRAV